MRFEMAGAKFSRSVAVSTACDAGSRGDHWHNVYSSVYVYTLATIPHYLVTTVISPHPHHNVFSIRDDTKGSVMGANLNVFTRTPLLKGVQAEI